MARVLALAVLAGAFITSGALFSVLLATGASTEGTARLLEGFGFSAGFFFVVLSGAVLFTEANVVLPAVLLGQRRVAAGVARFWVLAFVGNLAGAALWNLLPAGLGNVLGGALAVAVLLGWAHGTRRVQGPAGERAGRRNTSRPTRVGRAMTPRSLASLVALPAAAVLVLGGCAASPSDGSVLAAEDVFVEAPVVVPDVSGTSATLQVSTELNMACAVVFGTDEQLGDGIATDADMGGGAHTDHEAVMAGLEPDTEYYYRVQGSGSDGNLYRSELMTFRTPPADAVETPGENVAVGAEVVAVSSEFSDAFAAGNAVDGDPVTEWSSAGDGDDASLTIDLGRPVDVAGLALRSRSMGDGTSVVETFTVTVDDGETYGPFEAGTTFTVAEATFTGQVLRIDAERTTGGNTGAAEVEVYEAP